uniref:Retrovirus-related Pol polyprotein from transposon TNT 1-94 n=1 Tax=Cajanus cajan TaxID=3821 RepID=A0A151U420_CAJCA|nr:Retrovirus-related Pol polyprotein from transposon TNT 1-94 [Cajanus cajan]
MQLKKAQYDQLLNLFQSQVAPVGKSPQYNSSISPQNCKFIFSFFKNLSFTTYPHKGSSSIWILDSGATTHITCSIDNFICYRKLENQFVYLPTGSAIEVKVIGTVKLNNNFILHKVLFIPEFTVNLISVSSLTQFTGNKVFFYHSSFVIQDHQGSRVIGKGDILDSLYILKCPNIMPFSSILHSSNHNVTTASNNYDRSIAVNKWHYRLGHLSDDVLRIIHNNKSLHLPSNFSCKNCDICPLAKQKRLPFHTKNNLAGDCFDLVHCDIWGPFHQATYDNHKFFLTLVDDHSRFTSIFVTTRQVLHAPLNTGNTRQKKQVYKYRF